MDNKKVILTIVIFVLIVVIVFLILSPRESRNLQPLKKKEPYVGDDISGIKELVKQSLKITIKLLSTMSTPIPDVYHNCSGSTINKINFCGNLKASGGYDIGGSFVCKATYSTCDTGCTIACGLCKITPFVKCGTPCNTCPKNCKSVYDSCTGALKVNWSVNILYAFDLGNTMDILDFESFTIDKSINDTNKYEITMRVPVKSSPSVNIDIRTTASIGNYQGNIGLGNLKIVIPLKLYYDCISKQTTLKKLNQLEVGGINLAFNFATSVSGKLKEAIYALAKDKLENAVKNVLQTKLTPLFEKLITNEFLPRLQLGISC